MQIADTMNKMHYFDKVYCLDRPLSSPPLTAPSTAMPSEQPASKNKKRDALTASESRDVANIDELP